MPLRNGPHGYGAVTRTLHWLTVLLLAAQLTVGYVMDADDGGHGRGRGRGEGSGHGRGRGDDSYELAGLLPVHLTLGALILVVAIVRVAWRLGDGLPPWAESLSEGQRRMAHLTELILLALLFAIPLSGLSLLLGGDDWLPLHVATHVLLLAALAAHLALVLRARLLSRML